MSIAAVLLALALAASGDPVDFTLEKAFGGQWSTKSARGKVTVILMANHSTEEQARAGGPYLPDHLASEFKGWPKPYHNVTIVDMTIVPGLAKWIARGQLEDELEEAVEEKAEKYEAKYGEEKAKKIAEGQMPLTAIDWDGVAARKFGIPEDFENIWVLALDEKGRIINKFKGVDAGKKLFPIVRDYIKKQRAASQSKTVDPEAKAEGAAPAKTGP